MTPHRSLYRNLGRLPWPLVAIDFEASGLYAGSYPIEAGIARWRNPEAPIEIWSTLIRPPAEWRSRPWSTISQTVHGIAPEELEGGMDPRDVMLRLNTLVGRRAFCDGGSSDLGWLGGLEEAGGVDATFLLQDSDALGGFVHPRFYRRMVRWLDRATPRHRAAADAERLLRALAVGLSFRYGESVVLEDPLGGRRA